MATPHVPAISAGPLLPDFQIRNLQPAGSNSIVRHLAPSDYDELILSHPDSVLTYLDDDDGEHITVGSSLELEQRLKEPAGPLVLVQHNAPLLHTFLLQNPSSEVQQVWQGVIGRVGSVELGATSSNGSTTPRNQTNEEALPQSHQSDKAHELPSDEDQFDGSRPLLQAFETELAKLVAQTPRPDSSSRQPVATNDDSATTPDPPLDDIPTTQNTQSQSRTPAQVFAHHLRNVFNGVSHLTTTVLDNKPELRQYLLDHHGELPQNLHALLSTGLDTIDSIANVRRPENTRAAPDSATTATDAPDSEAVPSRSRSPRERRRNKRDLRREIAMTSSAVPVPFQVEQILARRYIKYENRDGPSYKQYLVRWAQRGPEDDVWYDEENLRDSCKALIEAFERLHPDDGTIESYTSYDEQRVLAYQSATLHCRTAGDRMVTYRRYPVAESVAPTDSVSRQGSKPSPLARRRSTAKSISSDSQASLYGDGRPAKRPQSPQQINGRTAFTTRENPAKLTTMEAQSTKSASPKSPTVDYSRSQMMSRAFTFDPVDVMSRYPPVSQLSGLDLSKETSTSANSPSSSSSLSTVPPPNDASNLRRANTVAFKDPVAEDSLLRRANTSASVWERKLEHRRRHGLAEPRTGDGVSPFEEALSLYPPRHAHTIHHGPRYENPAVRKCVQDLVSLGYKLSVADAVAGMCEGDLQKALDHFDEDRKAWTRRSDGGAFPSMPGGWSL